MQASWNLQLIYIKLMYFDVEVCLEYDTNVKQTKVKRVRGGEDKRKDENPRRGQLRNNRYLFNMERRITTSF